MSITYTVAECEAKITAIDAQIEDLDGLPDAGEIGDDRVEGLGDAWRRLHAARSRWVRRLVAARNGGVMPGLSRVI